MEKKYLIGTRGSLLAVTQCEIIKDEMVKRTGASFELKRIKTQGDQITDKPLWQLEGKDFFTKELDAALLTQDVDLVVHSYKDLGSERPEGIKLGCITQRKYPHDILLIRKDVKERLSKTTILNVGTSSPRRIVNIEKSLADYLPVTNCQVKCHTLRGNINTRIEKLVNKEYDAIVLALAGLERLANREDSSKILQDLVATLDFMILPTKDFPPAASQGALAIEHFEENQEIAPILKSVHDERSSEEIKRERKAFAEYGGGCHLAVGVHVKSLHDYYIHLHKGEVDKKEIFEHQLEGYDYTQIKNKKVYYVYSDYDFLINKKPIKTSSDYSEDHLFVTSSNCFHNITKTQSLWAAGNRTLRKLNELGYWVHGSAEGFGHQEIENFKNSKALALFSKASQWKVLSHDKASSTIGSVIASYTHELNKEIDSKREQDMLASDIIYWASFIQYETYTKKYPALKDKLHASGLGKTFQVLKEHEIDTIPCIDMNHLKRQTESQ